MDKTITVIKDGYEIKINKETEQIISISGEPVGNGAGDGQPTNPPVNTIQTETTPYTDANNKTAIIPEGFKVVQDASTNNKSLIDEGLVIEDSIGNQFVWIPVDGTNVPYAKWDGATTYVNAASTTDDDLPTGLTAWGQDENSQITKYKGFYIARYEAGIPDTLPNAKTTASETERNKSGYVPVSKKNSIPWTFIDYATSKSNAESMSSLYDQSAVVSGLVTGTQWDTAMKWLQNSGVNVSTDSRAWGNYKDAPVTGITEYSTNYGATWLTHNGSNKSTSTSWLLKTGHTDYTKAKNLYDLAGNVYEWTNEKYSSYRMLRGRQLQQRCRRLSSSLSQLQL